MNVCVPLYFRAPLGGLQSHVAAQIHALRRADHDVTVITRPGPFAEMARKLGAAVFTTDFADPAGAAERVIENSRTRFDLVHAHPFKARELGLEVARRAEVPFVLTLHSLYKDHLPDYAEMVDAVIAVSPAVRDHLCAADAIPAERITVIPNAVDCDRFCPGAPSPEALTHRFPMVREALTDPVGRRVLLVSRLDPDKRVILSAVVAAWRHLSRSRAFDIHWWVVGDGSERQALEVEAAGLNTAAGRQLVSFLGWQNEEELIPLYRAAHVCVGPGRCALEAMACGTPVLAIGSKGYVGLVEGHSALKGVYSNFGGTRDATAGVDDLIRDLESVVYDDRILSRLGRLSVQLARTFFDQRVLDEQLLRLYRFLVAAGPRAVVPRMNWRFEERPELAFVDPASGKLSTTWYFSGRCSELEIGVGDGDALNVAFDLPEGERVYLKTGPEPFGRATEVLPESWCIGGDQRCLVSCDVRGVRGAPSLQLRVIEYGSDRRRMKHTRIPLRTGPNRLEVITDADTDSIRLAIRMAGKGAATIAPIQLGIKAEILPPPPELRRQPAAPHFGDYEGENLLFIVGPPRSGTTWLLNLLRHHPEVVAASEQNLNTVEQYRPTLETNIFNRNRPFADAQIKRRFHHLSLVNPGKIIVEKTPAHLFCVDRIRRVFPKSALILIDRDGRDVVASLVHVGRDDSAWWQRAPSTVEEAARLWRGYGEASVRCRARHGPLLIRYEDLVAGPEAALKEILERLGLTSRIVPDLVAACADGKGIPIPGVFREGGVGGWRNTFTDGDVAAFKQEAGSTLLAMGHEKYSGWVR